MDAITVNEARQWLSEGKAVIIDVREPAEIASCSIENGIAAPLSQSAHVDTAIDENKALIVMCARGNRSRQALELITKQFPNHQVVNLEGGLQAWQRAGFDVKQSSRKVLPLDRQVQLTVGTMVFIGSLLGFFFSPWFFMLSGFFGAGLIFAGLSGTCGLALFLAKMPWNRCGDVKHCSVK